MGEELTPELPAEDKPKRDPFPDGFVLGSLDAAELPPDRPSATQPEKTTERPRSWGLPVLLGILVISLLGLGYYSVDAYMAAGRLHAALESEQDEHADTSAELESAVAEANGLRGQLDDTKAQLDESENMLEASEGDVASLERRMSALANEKAQAEDERNVMTLSAASWRSLSDRLGQNAKSMDDCVDLMQSLYNLSIEAYNGAAVGYFGDTDRMNRLAEDVWSLCEEVRTESWSLRQFVDSY